MAIKSSFKNMTLCLLVICLVCSALLAGVYALTKEPIEKAETARNEAAIKDVLPPDATDIEEEKTVDYNGETYTYNRAFDQTGQQAGYAINVSSKNGFGGPIKMKVGFNADGIVWNVKVLSHSETPGLGAKCTEPDFAGQFHKLDPSDPSNLKVKKDNGKLNAITASTITSRAYAEGVALAVEVFNAIGQTPEPHSDAVEDSAFAGESYTVVPSEPATVIPSEPATVIPSEVEESNELKEE